MARLLVVVGVRPHFVKLAGLLPQLKRSHKVTVLHTGQHYDTDLSDVFFEQLKLPPPDLQLQVGSGSRSDQVGQTVLGVGHELHYLCPDMVLVIGDTSTSVGAAIAAAELGIPVAHVEAGISCGDISTPEEVNRELIKSVTFAFFCPTPRAAARVGAAMHTYLVGDLLLDMTLGSLPSGEECGRLLARYGLASREFAFATVHRASNLQSEARCSAIVSALSTMDCKVLFSIHPGTAAAFQRYDLMDQLLRAKNVVVSPPLPYLDTLALEKHARVVISDSNGIQRESYFLGTNCVILRPNTEYPETVEAGGAVLIDPTHADSVIGALHTLHTFTPNLEQFGSGQAAKNIAGVLENLCLGASIETI